MIKKIMSAIDEYKSIAILTHVNADGDALCASFALADVLSARGKDVTCVLEEKPGSKYDFLGGEFVVYDDIIKTKYDVCIVVDCGSMERMGKRIDIFNAAKCTINIDHHKTNDGYATLNVVKPTYCAACEVIAEMFGELNLRLSDIAARLLYAGIMSDSGCLKFSSTTSSTHRIVADLLEYDFDHSEVARLLYDSNSMELTRLTGFVMNNVECFENGAITLISTDSDLLDQYGVEESDANALINIPRSIKGAEIAIEIKERGGVVRVSFRSNGKADVNRVAEEFGGGGHIRAAGATLHGMSIETAKTAVIAAATKELKRIVEQ